MADVAAFSVQGRRAPHLPALFSRPPSPMAARSDSLFSARFRRALMTRAMMDPPGTPIHPPITHVGSRTARWVPLILHGCFADVRIAGADPSTSRALYAAAAAQLQPGDMSPGAIAGILRYVARAQPVSDEVPTVMADLHTHFQIDPDELVRIMPIIATQELDTLIMLAGGATQFDVVRAALALPTDTWILFVAAVTAYCRVLPAHEMNHAVIYSHQEHIITHMAGPLVAAAATVFGRAAPTDAATSWMARGGHGALGTLPRWAVVCMQSKDAADDLLPARRRELARVLGECTPPLSGELIGVIVGYAVR